jgi:hypothetical protein
MFWIHFLFALVFALVLSSILAWGLDWRHPERRDAVGTSVLFLFLILLFAMWAGTAYLPPWGPVLYGTPWLNTLVIGLLVSLLVLAIAAPKRRAPAPSATRETAEEVIVVGTAFGIFFWILIIGLLMAALISYFK